MNVYVLLIEGDYHGVYSNRADAVKEIYSLHSPRDTKYIWEVKVTHDEWCATIQTTNPTTSKVRTYTIKTEPLPYQPPKKNLLRRLFSK